ncbi:MAG: M81 family metallopeptidase [Spirochaetales bacterium]|nr:M81 family metallopeptidase [Spirochaetales bacterium]
MSKRVLVAALHHESNSFNPIIADEKDFSIAKGEEIFQRLRPNDSLSGIVYTLLGMGWDVVPLLSARAVPNGEVSSRLYTELKTDLLSRAKDAQDQAPVDALVLSLHGSMRVENLGEAEGDMLKALRELFPQIPILCSLDMHATMTKDMHQLANGYVGYKCAPHIDCSETGAHAARMAIEALEHGAQPYSAWCSIPMVIAGEKSETTTEPMVTLIAELRKTEKKHGIMAASFLMGFPWANHSGHGVSAYVVSDGNPELAQAEAKRLADLFWSYRHEFVFHTETHGNIKAIDRCFEEVNAGNTPVYLSDSGDNPTAGSSGDVTGLLVDLMNHPKTTDCPIPPLFGGIYDPPAVQHCMNHIGERISLEFGALFDTKNNQRLSCDVEVLATVKKWGDFEADMALIRVQNVDVVLVSKHIGYIDPEMFRVLGANPAERDVVVCKLGYLTDPQRKVAQKSIMALSSGSTNEALETLPYEEINRPIYPLDQEMEFKAQVVQVQ